MRRLPLSELATQVYDQQTSKKHIKNKSVAHSSILQTHHTHSGCRFKKTNKLKNTKGNLRNH